MDLSGKRAVVTGGGSGIGLHLARQLANEGAEVTLTGRNEAKLTAAAKAHELFTPFVCDVTDDDRIQELVETLDDKGGCDLLINNAGVFQAFDMTKSFSLEQQLLEVDIDVNGPLRMVHYFLPGMLKRESAIVNVSSGLAFVPLSMSPVYSASKAFLHSWTQSLRAQLKGTSVRVIELMPPLVDTEMVAEMDPSLHRMPPETLADAFMKGLRGSEDEITPGQSGQLKLMRRLAPGFIFGQLNKQPRG
ncbi:MAG: SDR family NAD(P)-dependent oxidoreductase [Myxococcota bacterium]